MRAEHFKLCPKCQKATELDTEECEDCGHKFSTKFAVPATEPTRMVSFYPNPPDASPKLVSTTKQEKPPLFWVMVVFAAFIALSLWGRFMANVTPTPSSPPTGMHPISPTILMAYTPAGRPVIGTLTPLDYVNYKEVVMRAPSESRSRQINIFWSTNRVFWVGPHAPVEILRDGDPCTQVNLLSGTMKGTVIWVGNAYLEDRHEQVYPAMPTMP